MPGLMAMREQFGESKPLPARRSPIPAHDRADRGLIETLTALGAEVRWASCNIFSTQDEAAAAVVVGPDGTPDDPRGVPSSPGRGDLEEYWWCTQQALLARWRLRQHDPDDGGDATLLVHKGAEFEKEGLRAGPVR